MLKLFYACYFVNLGVAVPFFPAYLRQLGLSGQQVSVLLTIAPALQLGVPLAWGWLADRSRRPEVILRILCLGAFLASLPIIAVRSMPALFGIYFLQQIFAVAIVALADSVAVERSRQGAPYGRTRAAGSASFIATCLLGGAWLDLRAVQGGDRIVPLIVSVGYGLSFLAALGLKGHAVTERPHLADVRKLLGDRRFRFLLLVAGLHWASMVPYHGFFGVLLHDRGLSAKITSYGFVVGTAAEIVVFLLFARLRARFSLAQLLAITFAVSAARWGLFAYARSAALIVMLQIAHAFSFGMFWACAMGWIADTVPSKLRATGQVLYSMVTGIGSMVALPLAGALYDATGGAGAAFTAAGLLDLLPLTLVLLSLRASPAAAPDEQRA